MKARGLTKIRAGRYRHSSGQFIIQTDWDGPHGGVYPCWEIAEQDRHGGYVITSLTRFRTLRAAAAELDRINT